MSTLSTLEEPTPSPPPRGRSSLPQRILAAAIFLPSLFVITRHGHWQFTVLVELIVLTGIWEFYGLVEAKGLRPLRGVGVACALLMAASGSVAGGRYAGMLLAGTLLLVMSSELARRSVERAAAHISSTVFGILYVGWLSGHLVLLRELPLAVDLDYARGADFVFVAILLTWSCDTGAYFVGRAVGRHALMPKVSPRKTVEGAVGGIATALLAAWIAQRTFADYLGPGQALFLGLLAALAGITGDLVESLLKRDSRLKDSAQLIPGHGGTLDRFDSLFFSVPLVYYFHKFFVL